MRLEVNGETKEFSDVETLEDLLSQLEVDTRFTAVAVNMATVPRSRFPDYPLKESDRVEILAPFQGG